MDHVNFSKFTPKWMDQSYFEKVIRHSEKDPKAVVEEFELSPGSKPGENFASSIYRAIIKYKSKFTNNQIKTLSVIIKTQMIAEGNEGDHLKFLTESPLFGTEMEMYGKVLPEILSLWESVGENEKFCPKLIYLSNEPAPTIILEDIGAEFVIIDANPEDLEVSKKIFRRLAKFHAASFNLQSEQRSDYEGFDKNIFQNEMVASVLYKLSLEAFTEVTKEWKGFEKFTSNLEKFQTAYRDKCLKTYTKNEGAFAFNVLNHGDLHLRNMLFKRTPSNVIEDFQFIDFQLCAYATPAIDLISALYNFVSSENRKYRDELIVVYHQQFAESLKKFGYLKEIPSLVDLQVELLKNGHFEVVLALCYNIFFYIDFKDYTPEEMKNPLEAKKRMYNTPKFREDISKEFPRYFYNGFF